MGGTVATDRDPDPIVAAGALNAGGTRTSQLAGRSGAERPDLDRESNLLIWYD
jgi:hypothetical protein